MLVRMLVALLKEKKTFFYLKATSILTSIRLKVSVSLQPNADFHVPGPCLSLLGQGLFELDRL